MYKTVVFDVDGTMLDTRNGMVNAYQYTCEKLGLYETDYNALKAYVGINTTRIFFERHGLEGDAIENAREIYYEYFADKGMKESKLYDGMGQLLYDLRAAGIRTAVATARRKADCEMMLDWMGILGLFDYLHTAQPDEVLGDKDEALRDVMQKLDAPAAECVMIGDRKFDLNGAAIVGMDSIGVTYGFGPREELEACNPTYLVDDVERLRGILL